MLGPRAFRPLARAARPAVRAIPRSARSYASAPGPRPDPHGADEHGKTLLLTTAAVAVFVAAGCAVSNTREQHVAGNPGSEAEAEEEAEQPEAVSEEAKPALESVVKQKLEEAKEVGAELLGLESADGAIASLIAEAEGALGFGSGGDGDAEPSGQEALAAEAASQGAFNEETGEINWDCPCLGGMATGPCGEEFKAAFSCFVYSEAEPKGIDCVEKFKAMQDCFREHPDIYGEEELDEEEHEA